METKREKDFGFAAYLMIPKHAKHQVSVPSGGINTESYLWSRLVRRVDKQWRASVDSMNPIRHPKVLRPLIDQPRKHIFRYGRL